MGTIYIAGATLVENQLWLRVLFQSALPTMSLNVPGPVSDCQETKLTYRGPVLTVRRQSMRTENKLMTIVIDI